MDLLKRNMAPIPAAAWTEIDREATRVLKTRLSARKFVDVDGPHGPAYTSVNLGRLAMPGNQNMAPEGVGYGIYQVQPLVECRIPFELNIWELDNLMRGADPVNLDPVAKAAEKAASFEDRVVFNGLQEAGIVGIQQNPNHDPIPMGSDDNALLNAISRGILVLQDAVVEGPYALIAGSSPWRRLASHLQGYPLYRHVERLIGGPVIYSPVIDHAFLVSLRGGDLVLTLGQDFALGYESHTAESVRLFLMESFTFRVLDPAVIVMLQS